MSSATTFTLATPAGVDLFIYCWLPSVQLKAMLQIAHVASAMAAVALH